MQDINNLPAAGQEQEPERTPTLDEWVLYRASVDTLDTSIGEPVILPETPPTEQELQALVERFRTQGSVNGFLEMAASNEIMAKSAAIEFAADAEAEGIRTSTFNRGEYIVAQQMGAYYEGLGEAMVYIRDYMARYENIQDMIAVLPEADRARIETLRTQSKTYMLKLSSLMDERVKYFNTRGTIRALQKQGALQGEELQNRISEIVNASGLSDEGKQALLGTPQAMSQYAYTLEKSIILHAAGKKEVTDDQGKVTLEDEGFYPQELYMEILKSRYTQILEMQKEIVRAGRHEGGQVAKEQLDLERRSIMEQMIALTHEIGSYQAQMSGLFTDQNLFNELNVEGAAFSVPGSTDPEVRRRLNEGMTRSKEFHLGQLDAMTSTAQNAFAPGLFERMRDAATLGTITINEFQTKVLDFIGKIDFGTGFISGPLKDYLSGPMAEAMGWPRDPETGELKTRLTAEERQKMADKLGSLVQILNDFQRNGHMNEIQATTGALRALDATEGVADLSIGHPKDPLPVEAELIDAAAVPAKLAEYERAGMTKEDAVATLHAVLMLQLHEYWGEPNAAMDGGTGFIGAYAGMLSKVEDLIGVQLDVAGALFETSQRFYNAAGAVAIAAGGTFVVLGVVGAGAGPYILGKAMKVPGAIARRIWGRAPNQPVTPRGAPPSMFRRAVWTGAMAFEVYDLYQDIEAWREQDERVNQVKGDLEAQLVRAGFARDAAEPDLYVHPSGMKVRLSAIHEGVETGRTTQIARTVRSGATLTTMFLMGARTVAGPAGLVLTGVAVAVEGVITGWENDKIRDFLANPNTPPWLLAAKGTQALTQRSEYYMLENAASFTLFPTEEKDRIAVRNKMFFTIFNQELAGFTPNLYREIYAGSMNIEAIDTLYEEDFQSMILPYVYARLLMRSGTNGPRLTWEQISQGRINSGYFFIPPGVSNVDVRAALRESALFYVQHLREKRYLEATTAVSLLEKELEQNPNDAGTRSRLEDAKALVEYLGKEKVFGVPVSNVNDETVRQNGGTRAALLLERISDAADAGRLGRPMTLDISGMSASLENTANFSDPAAMLRMFTTDQATLAQISAIGPMDIENDIEASTDPLWFRQTLKPLIGSLPITLARLPLLQHRHAVEQVMAALDQPEAVSETASPYALQIKITEGIVRAVSEDRGRQPRFTVGGDESTLTYRGEGSSNADFGIGDTVRRDPRFAASNAFATFYEEVDLGGGQKGYLQTYLYGNPADESSISVLQRGMAHVDIAVPNANFYGLSTTNIRNEAARNRQSTYFDFRGQPTIMTAADFASKQPGGRHMLDLAMSEAQARKQAHDDAIREMYRRMRIDNRPEEMAAHETARNTPGTWVRLPEYGKHVCYIPEGNANTGFIYMRSPDDSHQPAFQLPPDPDEVRPPDTSPITVKVGGRSIRLEGDYREKLPTMDISPTGFNYALATPQGESAFPIQRILMVYGVYGRERMRLLPDMERELMRAYRQMTNDTDRRYFLQTMNDLCHKYTRRGTTQEYGSTLTSQLFNKMFLDLDLAMSQGVSGYRLVIPNAR